MGGYNGLVPSDYDDPRRPKGYNPYGDEEGGFTAPLTAGNVPRGTSVPQGTDSATIASNAGADPRQGRQPNVYDMPSAAPPQGAADMPFMPQSGTEGSPSQAQTGDTPGPDMSGMSPLPGAATGGSQQAAAAIAGKQQPQPIQDMQTASGRLSGMGPRPATMADVPKDQQHHGWRKALDIAAGIGMGAYTMNPMAGAGVFRALNHAPLRHAQETYDSRSNAAQGQFERGQKINTAEVGQERVEALNEKNRVLGERAQAYADKAENTFVAGTEVPDKTSPTGFSAQTVNGKMKPFTPKQDRAIGYDPKVGGFTMNGSRYVPKTIEEGASLEAGLSTQYRELAQGPYTQRWEKEKKNQAPVTHIHNPSAEELRYNDWKAAFRRDNGRDPNAEEIRTQKVVPKFDVNKEISDADKDRETQIAAQEKAFKAEWDKAYKDNDQKPDEATLKGLKDANDSRKASIMETYNRRVDQLKQKAAKEAAQPQPPPAQAQPAAATPQTDITQPEFNPRTGEPIDLPQSAKAYDDQGNEVPLSNVVQSGAGTVVKPATAAPAPGVTTPKTNSKVAVNQVVQVAGQYHVVKGFDAKGKPIISREVVDPATGKPAVKPSPGVR